MIFNPHKVFSKIRPLPVACTECNSHFQLEQPTDDQLDMLINASYLVSLRRELVLLQRTQELFDKFPDSRHPVKVAKSVLRTKESGFAEPASKPDQAFEEALQSDQELMHFLRPPTGSSSFYLPARLHGAKEGVENFAASVAKAAVKCTHCQTGFLCIQDPHFD